jgi:hypothetical protein
MYFTTTQTRDLQTIKFDQAVPIYEEAALAAQELQETIDEQAFQDQLSKMESDYTQNNEAPSEVSFADLVNMPKRDYTKIRRKAGQKALIEQFIPRYKLETILQAYVMPQVIRYLARDPKLLQYNKNGSINGLDSAKAIFNGFGSDWDKGLYLFLMLDSRSSWLKSQYKGDARAYCALVPLILYAFKLLHNIKYSQWDPETLNVVVNDSLYQAMVSTKPELTRDEILRIREDGLTINSGMRCGNVRKAETTHKLYHISETALGQIPELAQVMAAQIWCAHPSNRTKYMVLDPENWDLIPTPLISTNLFGVGQPIMPWETEPVEKKVVMPWEM